jgi:histidine triad (HIT) family protein
LHFELFVDCIFCKIIAGKVPSDNVYQDDEVVAFADINPKAPKHILIVPRKHIASVNEVMDQDKPVLGKLFLVAKKIAQEQGIASSGYKLVVNTGRDAGQIVYHLHLHLLGGWSIEGVV